MWRIKNTTPYAAGHTWTRDCYGRHQWIVVVKATFDISETGKVSLSDEQMLPLLMPEYHGEPGTSSLRYDADLVAFKPSTDVTLLGQAYAPQGRPTHKVAVSLRVGQVKKELLVYGPRIYAKGFSGITLSSPAEFTVQTLTYELAYGGSDLRNPDPQRQVIDMRNPVGRGIATTSRELIHRPAHQIEYPQGNPAKMGPAGFGPLASHWSPRLELAGTYDERWQDTQKPLLPLDYNPRHELCSPADQQPAHHFVGHELVELENLCENGRWRFYLPRLNVSFQTAFGRKGVEHGAQLSAVIIEPDRRRIMMTWQGSLPVSSRECDYLDSTIVNVQTA